MKIGKNSLYGQLFLLIIFSIVFLKSRDPLILILGLGALGIVLIYAFQVKKFNDKYLYGILHVILVVQGLTLIYTYLSGFLTERSKLQNPILFLLSSFHNDDTCLYLLLSSQKEIYTKPMI